MAGKIVDIVGIEIACKLNARINDTVVSGCVSKYTKWTESKGERNER